MGSGRARDVPPSAGVERAVIRSELPAGFCAGHADREVRAGRLDLRRAELLMQLAELSAGFPDKSLADAA